MIIPSCDQCRRLKEKCEGGVPCRRCTHFRRPCEFSALGSAGHEAGGSQGSQLSNTYIKELLERARYMETILKATIRDIALDTVSLRGRAEDILTESPVAGESSRRASDDDNDAALEEEVCTINPVEDTTTRRCRSPLMTCTTDLGRLLWRVLILELLNAHQTSTRRPDCITNS